MVLLSQSFIIFLISFTALSLHSHAGVSTTLVMMDGVSRAGMDCDQGGLDNSVTMANLAHSSHTSGSEIFS